MNPSAPSSLSPLEKAVVRLREAIPDKHDAEGVYISCGLVAGEVVTAYRLSVGFRREQNPASFRKAKLAVEEALKIVEEKDLPLSKKNGLRAMIEDQLRELEEIRNTTVFELSRTPWSVGRG